MESELSRLRKKQIEESKKKYLEDSKTRLSKIQKKKLQTAFIGAISEIENFFGFLWGFKPQGECYSEFHQNIKEVLKKAGMDDNFFYDLWEQCRTRVLNNGNNQVRAMSQEMEQYTIHWDRYHIDLPVKFIPNSAEQKDFDNLCKKANEQYKEQNNAK